MTAKRKPRKKKQALTGFIHSGVIFIGDTGYMADTSQNYADGIIPADPLNPFKDNDAYLEQNPTDHNLPIPNSFTPGRGVAIHTNMLSGAYTVTKRICKQTGKLLEIKVKFRE